MPTDTRTEIESARIARGMTAEAMCKGIILSNHYSAWKHGRLKSIPQAKIDKLRERVGLTAEPAPGGTAVNPLYKPETVGGASEDSEIVQANAAEVVAADDREQRLNTLRVKRRFEGLTSAELDELNRLEGR